MSQFIDEEDDRRKFPYSNIHHTSTPLISIGIPILYGMLSGLVIFLFNVYNDVQANKYKLESYIERQNDSVNITNKENEKLLSELKNVSARIQSIEDTLTTLMLSRTGKK